MYYLEKALVSWYNFCPDPICLLLMTMLLLKFKSHDQSDESSGQTGQNNKFHPPTPHTHILVMGDNKPEL